MQDTEQTTAPAEHLCPVSGSERYASLDTLRGIAVLGILVMNVYAFAMPFIAYMNPYAWGGTEPWNLGTWYFTHLFFDQKFMTIFSMLFGAGIVLMSDRAEQRSRPFAGVFYRRSTWLLLLGAAHAYLIWFGDILFFYAAVGMLAYFFRRCSPKTLIIVACCVLPIALLFSFLGGTYMGSLKERAEAWELLQAAGETLTEEQQATIDEWDEARGFMVPGEEELNADIAAYSSGYGEIVAYRAPQVLEMQIQGTFFFLIWRVGGLMLIGMALMKLGVLTAERDNRFYKRMMLLGYGLGLPFTIGSAVILEANEFDAIYMFTIGSLPNYIGSILVAFGHIGLVMLIVRTGALASLMRRFAAVGRMALSNYLAHSLILTTVFYGYGLGLYAEIPRLAQMGFVAAVIGLQLIWSPWWLARYRFGPFEWLWRSLTYWQRQPMRV